MCKRKRERERENKHDNDKEQEQQPNTKTRKKKKRRILFFTSADENTHDDVQKKMSSSTRKRTHTVIFRAKLMVFLFVCLISMK